MSKYFNDYYYTVKYAENRKAPYFMHFLRRFRLLDAKDPIFKQHLIKRKLDIAYLKDLFTKFFEVDLQLQGDSPNLSEIKSIVAASLARIKPIKFP